MAPLDHFDLISRLDYDPATGLFRRDGVVCDSVDDHGYIKLRVGGRVRIRAHRLAWFYMTGCWPKEIDHINGVRTDNRFVNLRNVNRSQNQQNLGSAKRTNKVGLIGVSLNKPNQLWRAQIQVDKQKIHLGDFATPELAHRAYMSAKKKLHSHGDRLAT